MSDKEGTQVTPQNNGEAPVCAVSRDATESSSTNFAERPAEKKKWMDLPSVGWTLFSLTILLFCWIVASAGYKPDTASKDCFRVWRANAPTGQAYTMDVTDDDIRVGDQVCVRVAVGMTDAGARDRRTSVFLPLVRRWHLLLNGNDVAQSVGRETSPNKPLVLSFTLPAPTSASAETAAVIASLWTGGVSRFGTGTRYVSLRLRADAVAGSPTYDLVRHSAVRLHVFEPGVAYAGVFLLIIFTGGIVWLARNTSLLRDRPDVTSPSSLAKTQMAFWFALTIAGFCYIWLLTGIWQDVVTPGTLILLGIALTTGLGATAIASPKSNAVSNGFLLDILSEQTSGNAPAGVTVHRLIMATWTIVLGGVFASTVIWTERFPAFDPVLLTLMGISSGAYVGFKWLDS